MYNVADNFFIDITKYGRQFDNQILVNGKTEPISIYDINIFKHRFNASLFQSVMRVIEIDSNIKIEKNSIITGKIGIKFNEEDSYTYISYNDYKTIEEPEYDEDTKAYVALAYDKMREAMIPYDLTPTFPIKVKNFIILICNRLNWDTSNIPASFINSETLIYSNVFADINYTFRDVLDEIAKITCSFPCFVEGNFTLKYISETNKTITNDYLKEDNLNFKKEYYINSVVFTRTEDVDPFYKKDNLDIAQNGLHEYRLSDLQILSDDNRSNFMNEMYTYLRTLKFWIFDIQTTGVFIFDIADRFTVQIDNTNYSVVLLNAEGIVEQGLSEQMYTDEPAETETDYNYATSDEKLDRITKILIDKQNKKIIQLTSDVTEQSTQITQIEQTVDEISQKVENITDLTQTVTGTQTIALAECAEGELLSLNIKGNNTVFKPLFPMSNLYPANNLYPGGDSLITVTDKDEDTVEYNLGVTEVLRQNGDIYDEYILANGQAKVIRRINADGTVKGTEEIENLGTLNILLKEGTNTIKIKSYTAEILAKYAVKSDYTDVFATKVEMNSAISQTAEAISTEVNKKVDDKELGTKITQNYESVQIAWNKISEFIQFINAQLQIKNDSKQLLMALDKIGQHFYRTDGSEIGYTGLVNDNKIAFVLSGIQSGSGMVWGIKYNDNFIPVFSYEGYNTETGTGAGGIFYFEAPVYLQENTLYLGQDEDSPYIKALDSGRKTFTIGNVDDLYIRDISGNNLITLNNGYLKLVDFLEVGINLYGDYSFDFKNNRIINVANMATSDEVDSFSATTGDYLYVGLRDGGGFTLYPSSSDERLKKDIENSTETAIDKIMKIKHRKFKWKKDNSQIDIGYIAQELEELDKNFIHKNTHKTKEGQIEYEYQINLLSVLATATKAIQEQQEEIEELRQRINQLERKNSNGKDSI